MHTDRSLDTLFQQKDTLLLDGATGTNYFKMGLETGHPPELWNIEQPEKVRHLYRSFIESDADIILANSFGGTHFRLKLHQAEDQVLALNKRAAELAREEAEKAGRMVLVGASVGPTGELFEPLGGLTETAAVEAFAEQADALKQGGADLICIETMSSLEETRAAIKGAREAGMAVSATLSFDTAARTMMGVEPLAFADFAEAEGLVAFGANCGIGPAELIDSVLKFAPSEDKPPVIAKGNCGIPSYQEGEIHYHGTPELMAAYALFARDAGARIIGGCCGTTPEHLAAMSDALAGQPRAALDHAVMLEKLGEAWKDLPDKPDKQRRSRRTARRAR